MSERDFKVFSSVKGLERIDFDKKPIKKTIRQQAGEVRKVARRMLARKAVSAAGEAPGKVTGALQKSVTVKVSSGGFWAKVEPFKKDLMDFYYPAVLFYGSTKINIAKRSNYMVDALEQRRVIAQAAIYAALRTSLKPR